MVKKTFETALKQLEEIVREMESGDLSLEQAVKKYEVGIGHSKFCLDILDQTEKKITQLTRDNDGSLKEKPFDHE
ncbi:MAG: exodeoxyribonuclease VII small subunit [Proteobacteria bacterium]|nr:exodeoxyribonuclease VII small subunit [Desulfobacula sp.]MBU3952159.1 exodeoxyribonuclease VII small subunit [Pseudomonadota bacterium]MBU4132144.1 exodeoxyribonuclease VII small subunit [Pseudomonadota bacterium]